MKDKKTQNVKKGWLTLITGENRTNSIFTLPVLSGSMHPYLKPEDQLLIMPVSWKQCHMGDIIIFREENHLVAHRLLFRYNIKEKVVLYQKGDRNPSGTFIKPEKIVGKALAVMTKGATNYRYFDQTRQQRLKARIELIRDFYNRIKSLLRFIRWKKN